MSNEKNEIIEFIRHFEIKNQQFLSNSMTEKRSKGLENVSSEIQNLIGVLKKEWRKSHKEEMNCSCEKVWSRLDNSEKKKLKNTLINTKELIDNCLLGNHYEEDSEKSVEISDDLSDISTVSTQ
uniref:Uncharacterized protein n=1 Tax=Caenorhabditis tropicalis TaxID=1561998 RepID=A0A1I7V0E4_9PELO